MTYRKITYIMLVLLMSISIFGGQKVEAATSFADIPSKDEALEEISYLTRLGVIAGYTEGGKVYYKPYNLVTRGQAAKMVVISAGYQPLSVAKSTYSDVQVGTELSGYVERATQLGLFSKSTNGKFNPNTALLRGEMSYVLAKAFKLDSSQYADLELPFADIMTNNAYYQYISAIYYNGITQGSNGKYNTSSHVTRKQFALFVARAKNDQYKLDLPLQGVSVPNKQYAIGQVKVTTNILNVRSSTDSSSSKNLVGQVKKDNILNVYADEGGWLKVDYNNEYAYVSKQYTSYVNTSPAPAPPTVPTTVDVIGRVTVDGLNVRSGAGTNYSSLGTLKKGTKVTVQSVSGYWAKISYNNTVGYVHKSFLKLLNQTGNNVIKNRIIIIDPGHGGKDPGTVKESTTEKAIVLKVASLVKQKLEANGAKVVMTRTGDTYPTLEDRVSITDKNYGEIFVSIHVNAAGASAKGTETFYSVSTGDMYQEDVDLATFINNQIVKNASMYNRGVKKADYYVTRNMIIPSVLVELGFLSNDEDRAKLVNNKYVEIFAQSIYNGIVEYYAKQ